jgi:hypothetical protein
MPTRATSYQLTSPNKKISLHIRVGDRIEYDLLLNEQLLLKNSTLALDVDHRKLGINPQVLGPNRQALNRDPSAYLFPQKFALLHEQFN